MSALRRLPYAWWRVAGLSLTELVSWGVLIYAFPVLTVPMHRELGWPYSSLNAAYATGVAVSAAAGMPVGRWLQLRGPRPVMTAGTMLTAAALVGWSRVDSVPELFAVCVVAGLAMAMTLYEPALATTTMWFTEHRARAVLVITMVAGLASMVFGPLAAHLAQACGWRGALLVLVAVTLVVCLPVHVLMLRGRPAPRQRAAPSGRSAPLRRRSFAWLTAGLALATFAKSVIVAGLAAYLVWRGFPLTEAALAAGGIGVAQIGGRIALIALRGWWPEQHVAAAAFVLQAGALVPLVLTTGHGAAAETAVLCLVLVFGAGCGLVEVLRGVLLPEFYGVAEYPRINGAVAIFVVGARALAPVVVGLALSASSVTALLLVTVGVAAAAGGALMAADRAFRRERAGRPAAPRALR